MFEKLVDVFMWALEWLTGYALDWSADGRLMLIRIEEQK